MRIDGATQASTLLSGLLRIKADTVQKAEAEAAELAYMAFGQDLSREGAQTATGANLQSDAASAGVQAPPAQAASSNLMSRNFFNANYKRSKYVTYSLEGLQLENTYATKMNSLVGSLVAQAALIDLQREFGGDTKQDDTYIVGTMLATKSSKSVDSIRQEEVGEKSEETLEDAKKRIEDKAREALGQEELTDQGTIDPTPAPDAPAIEGAAEAAPIETAPAPAAGVALPEAYRQAGATAPLPSLDVVV